MVYIKAQLSMIFIKPISFIPLSNGVHASHRIPILGRFWFAIWLNDGNIHGKEVGERN